jgi:hypothetical protein
MFECFIDMLKGVKGEISSKRVVTFLAFIWVSIAFLVNVFMQIHLEEHIFDGMLYLVISGMGLSAFEKFSPEHAHGTKDYIEEVFELTEDHKEIGDK